MEVQGEGWREVERRTKKIKRMKKGAIRARKGTGVGGEEGRGERLGLIERRRGIILRCKCTLGFAKSLSEGQPEEVKTDQLIWGFKVRLRE